MFDQLLIKKEEGDAIIVENVSKRFRIPHEKRNTVLENITGIAMGRKQDYDEFSALQDISFRVKKGEKLGIVGENGSGKSTLLKIISGVLVSDTGSVKVFGKVAPFLELGVGFQPELTAEENVRLYGAVMGMNKKDIEEKFDEIFEFAELERFKMMKLKNFSSGMYMRLAFATATVTDPDILLIDEVLAVGDEAFQRKCFDKINEFKKAGKTIVLVTHDLETVKRFCDSAMLLDHGRMISIGNSEMVIDDYRINMQEKEESVLVKQHEKVKEQIEVKSEAITQTPEQKHIPLNFEQKPPDRWGSREIEITDVHFYNENREETHILKTGDKMIVKIIYLANNIIEKPVFGVAIYRNDGLHINGTNSKIYNVIPNEVEGYGEVEYIIDSLQLLEGTYLLSAAVFDYDLKYTYDHHHERFTFKVTKSSIKDEGVFYIPCKWEYKYGKFDIKK